MIFAFLYGLSMDYEVFMIAAHARGLQTKPARPTKRSSLGLARTGKLVTSGALILMFAFLVLSTSPGYEVEAGPRSGLPPGSSSTPRSCARCSCRR